MAADLRTVAEASGVSISTASRALNGSPKISSRTRSKVIRVAASLGYRPNIAARGLRTRRSDLIGLVLPNLLSSAFLRVAERIQQVLRENGYEVVLSITGSDEEQELATVQTLVSRQVDGIIGWGMHERTANSLAETGIPVIHLDQQSGPIVGDSVRVANLETTREVARYLLARGHTRIGLINGPDSAVADGYRLAIEEAGLVYDPQLLAFGKGFNPEAGFDGVTRLMELADPPTALYLCCQEVWSSALPRLHELGYQVGANVSVVCRDDDPMLRWWRPPITVVDVDIQRVADITTRLLLERIHADTDSEPAPFADFVVNTRMIERESVAVL